MGADGDQSNDDGAALQRLRRRLYQREARDVDLSAYRELRTRLGDTAPADHLRTPTDALVDAPSEDPAEGPFGATQLPDPPLDRRGRHRRRALLIAVTVAAAVAVAVLSWPREQSLGPLTARRQSLVPLSSTGSPALPTSSDAAAAARFFASVTPAGLEHTTAARKPFFGAGIGPTDFPLNGYDIGAGAVAITLVTDPGADVSVTLASGASTAGLHRVLLAAGHAPARRALTAAGTLDGLEAPRVLRIDVPQGTRFAVRSVFLTPIDLGTIDR